MDRTILFSVPYKTSRMLLFFSLLSLNTSGSEVTNWWFSLRNDFAVSVVCLFHFSGFVKVP